MFFGWAIGMVGAILVLKTDFEFLGRTSAFLGIIIAFYGIGGAIKYKMK